MLETTHPRTASRENEQTQDFEIEIGRDSVMTVRISCGAQTSINPDVLPRHRRGISQRWKADSGMRLSPEGPNV